MGCSSIENIFLPDSINFIDTFAFSSCDKLKSINLPIELTTISGSMFHGCSNLESIYIHKNITNIAIGAFNWCDNLDKIVVDSENTVYDSRDNSNAIIETATNKLIVGSNNTIIPESVTVIGDHALHGRIKLKNIYIHKGISSIGTNAFGRIPSVEKIEIDKQNPTYDSRDNSNAIIETATNKLITGCKNTVIPNTVTIIGRSAFWYSTNLEKIDIPSSVVEIETSAFNNCTSLGEVNIANGLTKINLWSFGSCTNLESIIVPESVVTINKNSFGGSNNLKTIYYKGTATGAPWGATNATVIKDY